VPQVWHQLGEFLQIQSQVRRYALHGRLCVAWPRVDVSDARKLKTLEEENAKLKRLLAEQMLDNAMLKDINSKKW